jgi:hypothetical protein
VPSSRRADRIEGFVLDLVLIAVGGLLGLIGCFLVPLRIGNGIEGLAAAIALVGNAVAGLLGGWGTRATRGALLPGIGWFAVVAAVNLVAPGGDVIVPGKLAVDPGVVDVGYAFLVLGILGTIAAISLTSLYTRRLSAPRQTE